VLAVELFLYSLPLAFLLGTGCIVWVEHLGNAWQILKQWPDLSTSPLLCTPYLNVIELLLDALMLGA
jgi:hypothetical protein